MDAKSISRPFIPDRVHFLLMGAADQEGRRGLVHMSLASVIATSMAIALYAWRGVPWRPWLVVWAVSAACLGVGLVARRAPRRVSLAVFAFEALVVLAALWVSGEALAASGQPFSPFNGNKIFALLVATFCPSVWLGGALIAIVGGETLGQTAHWGAAARGAMPEAEPAQTLIIAIAAIVFLERRRRQAALAARLRHVEAERRWLDRVARLASLVRELTEDLLKTVRGGVAAVRLRHSDLQASTARMMICVERLERLNSTLAPLEPITPAPLRHAPPQPAAAEASLDAIVGLQRELRAGRLAPSETPAEPAPPPLRDTNEEARSAALGVGAITFLGGLPFLWLLRTKNFPVLPGLLLPGVGGAVVALALAARHWGARVFKALFATTVLVAIGVTLYNNDAMARRGHFDAFPGLKLAVLVVAFLAPTGRLGAALIAVAILGPVTETYFVWSVEQRSRMPLLEPWPTVIVGLTALAVLAGRQRRAALAQTLAQAQARQAGDARMATLALSMRDFANTPLQTLAITAAVARRKHADPALDEIRGAVERLGHLTAALTPLATMVEHDPADLSFDALERMAAEVRQSLRRATGLRGP
jgi:hypothetical protein